MSQIERSNHKTLSELESQIESRKLRRLGFAQSRLDDAELFAKLERRAVHFQERGRTVWSRDKPSGLFECRQYLREQRP